MLLLSHDFHEIKSVPIIQQKCQQNKKRHVGQQETDQMLSEQQAVNQKEIIQVENHHKRDWHKHITQITLAHQFCFFRQEKQGKKENDSPTNDLDDVLKCFARLHVL